MVLGGQVVYNDLASHYKTVFQTPTYLLNTEYSTSKDHKKFIIFVLMNMVYSLELEIIEVSGTTLRQ